MPLPSAAAPAQAAKSPSWLAVAAMLTDLAFETDPLGRFTGFGPGKALGQNPANLVGVELATLVDNHGTDEALTQAQLRAIVTTICLECVAWHGRARLLLLDGTSRLFRLALAPRLSGGTVTGTFGILFDLEAPELAPPERHTPESGIIRDHNGTLLDPETGLWSPRAFKDEMARRFDRLDVEELPGTLLYLGFPRVTAALRTPVAMRLAEELRDVVRPTDLLGRVEETTIGLWCDGMDHLTGGERAAKFCTTLPPLLPGSCPISIGVATRWPGTMEDVHSVLGHAAAALRQAMTPREGSPPWLVWQNV